MKKKFLEFLEIPSLLKSIVSALVTLHYQVHELVTKVESISVED